MCLWLNSALAAHPHTGVVFYFLILYIGLKEKIRGLKARKFMGLIKIILLSEAIAMHTNKAKQRIHSPFPMGRKQAFSHSQEKGSPGM